MAQPVKLGIVGAGSIAIRAPLDHFAVGDMKDKVIVSAICDPVAGRARAAAEKYGVTQAFESYEEMLAKGDVQAVTICSPIGLHFDQGMKAVKAGKHIHFNKTMTTTVDEANKLMDAASRAGVKIVASPGQMLRPQNLRIRKQIAGGAIGKVVWAAIGAAFGDYHETESVRLGNDVLNNIDPSWYFRRPGGGPVFDMTVYALHSLTGILGPVKRVTAMSGIVVPERDFKGKKVACDMDDNTIMTLDFGNSVFALAYGVAAGWLVPSLDFPVIYGTKGQIEPGHADGKQCIKLNGEAMDYPGRDNDKNGCGHSLTEHAVGKHADMDEVHVFEDIMQLVRWIREGIPSIVSAEHARHVIEIIDAGYRAAKTGKVQDLKSTFSPVPGA